jgi:hypothetical protein
VELGRPLKVAAPLLDVTPYSFSLVGPPNINSPSKFILKTAVKEDQNGAAG